MAMFRQCPASCSITLLYLEVLYGRAHQAKQAMQLQSVLIRRGIVIENSSHTICIGTEERREENGGQGGCSKKKF